MTTIIILAMLFCTTVYSVASISEFKHTLTYINRLTTKEYLLMTLKYSLSSLTLALFCFWSIIEAAYYSNTSRGLILGQVLGFMPNILSYFVVTVITLALVLFALTKIKEYIDLEKWVAEEE